MPKNFNTKSIFEKNELHSYGLVPDEMKETFSLEKIIDNRDNVKKISAGNNHFIVLFESGKIGVYGDNSNGQLGLPFVRATENKVNKINIYVPNFEEHYLKNYSIIDVACGENFSLLLVFCNQKNYLFRLGYSQEDRYRDDIDKINPIVFCFSIPIIFYYCLF